MRLTKDDLLAVPHVRMNNLDRLRPPAISGVSTDTRTLKNGNIFFALRGEKFDGHEFLPQAIEAGASLAVVDRAWFDTQTSVPGHATPVLVVENTTQALGQLATVYRKKIRIPVLAVVGSNGKTTTKEMIAAVLRTTSNVLSTEGNLNNHIGVPLMLFKLQRKHRMAVLELGTNHPGEIDALCRIAEPTHGLITNVGHEHLEFFGDLDGVAQAEGELFRWLAASRSRMAFVNADDGRVVAQASRVKRRVRYGFEARNVDVQGTLAGLDARACARIRVKKKGQKEFDLQLRVPGQHNAMNALAAATVGIHFKVPAAKIRKALQQFSGIGKRMEVLNIAGATLINDTYNSNVDSTQAALRTLTAMETKRKRIAVLADMLELGAQAEGAHRAVGEAAGELGIDALLTYGPLSRFTHEAAVVKFKVHYDQKNVLAEYLAELIGEGDVALIKGSRGMNMEDVVAFLLERKKR